jgi:lipopolysaccharide export system protein LptA
LRLSGGVRLATSAGVTVETAQATADLSAGTASAGAVTATAPLGAIAAGALDLASGEDGRPAPPVPRRRAGAISPAGRTGGAPHDQNLRRAPARPPAAGRAAPTLAQDVSLGGPFVSDPDAPLEVTSETLSVDQATGAAVFEGTVVVSQGDLRLQAGRVEVLYDEAQSEIARLMASGGVTLVTGRRGRPRRRRPTTTSPPAPSRSKARVLLTQGPSAISADRMVVDLDAGTARMDGNVRTILQRTPAP